MTEPTPMEARSSEPPFHEGLQGFASFCETCARDGKMAPDDCLMVAGKLRDASFVVDQLQKRRDALTAVAKAYEAWEAAVVLEGVWDSGLPKLTQPLFDRLLEIQTMRNAALSLARPMKDDGTRAGTTEAVR